MPKLDGAWNFRDVADVTGLRPGRFFRSSELSLLDDEGREELRRLGIADVADLRSPREVERRGPGRVPDGVEIHSLPFPDLAADTDGESPHQHTFTRMMTEMSGDESVADAGEPHGQLILGSLMLAGLLLSRPSTARRVGSAMA